MNIAGTLRRARRSAGLSQQEMARRAGVPQSTIGRIEADLTTPAVDTLQRLLALCGWSLEGHPHPRATTNIIDSHPYFLWDSEMTLREFRLALRSRDDDIRGWALARLLEHGNWVDIWQLVSRRQAAQDLHLTTFRGKDVWERLLCDVAA